MLAKIITNFQIMIFILFYLYQEFNYKILFYKFLKICACMFEGNEWAFFEDLCEQTFLFAYKNCKKCDF